MGKHVEYILYCILFIYDMDLYQLIDVAENALKVYLIKFNAHKMHINGEVFDWNIETEFLVCSYSHRLFHWLHCKPTHTHTHTYPRTYASTSINFAIRFAHTISSIRIVVSLVTIIYSFSLFSIQLQTLTPNSQSHHKYSHGQICPV